MTHEAIVAVVNNQLRAERRCLKPKLRQDLVTLRDFLGTNPEFGVSNLRGLNTYEKLQKVLGYRPRSYTCYVLDELCGVEGESTTFFESGAIANEIQNHELRPHPARGGVRYYF